MAALWGKLSLCCFLLFLLKQKVFFAQTESFLFLLNQKVSSPRPGKNICAAASAGLGMKIWPPLDNTGVVTPHRLKWEIASGKGMETAEMSRCGEALAIGSREEGEEEEEEGENAEGEGEEAVKVDGDGDDEEAKTDDSTEMECRWNSKARKLPEFGDFSHGCVLQFFC